MRPAKPSRAGPYDAPETTQAVLEQQIVGSRSAIAGALPDHALDDEVSASFFADGARQEASGVFIETGQVRVRSLDRVRRRWGPLIALWLFLLGALAAAGGAAAWWMGVRPPPAWERSAVWQALRLPPVAEIERRVDGWLRR